MKLGKTPARPDSVKLKLIDYFDHAVILPKVPKNFGHGNMVKYAWNMLGNDSVGDCVCAGAAHETMLWNATKNAVVAFTADDVIGDYSAATGYVPGQPNTDNGTDMQQYAKYRQNTGIVDWHGNRHKIGAYLALKPGDLMQQLAAAYIFGTVGLGIQFPNSAMDQFNKGQPWDVVPGSSIEGGHYIPLIARDGGMNIIVTWGKEFPMTDAFFRDNNDESIVYISAEFLAGGMTIDGFNLSQLQADLKALKTI